MASNPPFHLEDQTDEDFFDQLVNDDDLKVPASSTSFPSYGSDSDEVKAFANLSIGDESGGKSGVEAEGELQAQEEVVEHNIKSIAPSVEENNSVVFPNSSGFVDNVIDSNNGDLGTEVKSDPTISKSSGSNGSGVKEVQWSAFGADSAQNDSNGNVFGSYSDFFAEVGNKDLDAVGNDGNTLHSESKTVTKSDSLQSSHLENSNSHLEYQEGHAHGTVLEQATDGQDLNSSQDWENAYPGWKYNYSTGQWEPVDGYYPTSNMQENTASYSAADWTVSYGKSEVSYLQQTPHSVAGNVVESGMTGSVPNWNQVSPSNDATWNQVSQGNKQYPEHMFFDDQYPGWYYDTIAQEWRSLDSYISSFQSNIQSQDHTNQSGFASTNTFPYENHQKTCSEYGQVDGHASKDIISQGQVHNWNGSFNNNYSQHGSNTWQPESLAKSEATSDFSGHQQLGSRYSSHFTSSNLVDQNQSHHFGGAVSFYNSSGQAHNDFSAASGPQTFVPRESYSQHFNQPSMKQDEQRHTSNDYYNNQNSVSFSEQQFQSGHQFSYAPTAGLSSAGRPPHALVSFCFGGKLIVMKNGASLTNSSFASQDTVGGSISVLNLMEVFTEKDDSYSIGLGVCDYFHTLCRQSFPGPLSSGNVAIKELNKWIDERITYCESASMDSRKGEVLRLLLSLIKITCQHYGKLRSPFGTEASSKESDTPESAVARLFASTKKNGAQFTDYGSPGHCLQKLPSEGQIRATASEVQSLLISGRTTEALHCAQQGHLWGPALVLAGQLGDQFYVETVKQMALRQLVAGSPLRTLCLLIAGQPADVFSMETTGDSGIPGAVNMSQQSVQPGCNGMLDDWEENLAVITANRTKDDELVLLHLGDCLWKERTDIIAAHICYLVAETNFEPYSDTARMCLIGADHWKFPRTYASPEAIQRTEVYEYSKVLGNSQFVLLPFQPYKILYAHMLAEVGRVSDSLKYCQAVLKSLKTGRAPEVEVWRQSVSSLEERIRTHQQGGFSANLVGKLLNLFDSTAHRVAGVLPPPAPSTSAGSAQSSEQYHMANGPRVSTSHSTMAMSSLMPSESMEPISEWATDGNKKMMHNRSVSEPDFGRSPRQVDGKDPNSADGHGKAQAKSRFGRFGFGAQLLQKTVGFLKPRPDKQAKLGETNKFYFDEKLKTWVEAGAEPPAEVAALAPPPSAGFQEGNYDYNLNRALKNEGPLSNGNLEHNSPNSSESSTGIPPLPPTTNQFSARGRMGVRSRYVDTFNQGGGAPTNLFQSPSVPSIKSTNNANPKFFVPTPVSSDEQPFDVTGDNTQESASIHDNSSVSATSDSVMSSPPSSSMAIPRFPSMGSISNTETSGNGARSLHSRRTASWSGTTGDAFTSNKVELRPLGEVLGMPPASFVPRGPSLTHSSMNGGSFGDDLHEVEL